MTLIATTASVVVVDVANVMGARADGWWRDRAGAALRLCTEVIALARRGDETAGAWVLVLEGQARQAVALLETLRREHSTLQAPAEERAHHLAPAAEQADAADDRGGHGEQDVVPALESAPGSGDDAIVGVVAETVAGDESCLVVTADRELRQRCEELNASVVGPGWLLRLL